eukprot:TRINITY_DN13637_c0_g1_i1.p1 TRINITY_DN13637_c0_g1~~TRINITY_DN13637_c0_g1_i1.p1  ORF type:complete len:672 (+),score=77.31 TRINITY_DN13637_c0_g1_i1:146-2161(+)
MAESWRSNSGQQTWAAQTGLSTDCWTQIISFLPFRSAIKFSLINRRCLSFVPKHIVMLRDSAWFNKACTRLFRLEHLTFTWEKYSGQVFPNKRQIRFLLLRNPKLKTLVLQNTFTLPKERWIEEIIPAGVQHLDIFVPSDLLSVERLAGRLKLLHTLVLRTNELESTEKLDAILMPWKNHTKLVNVSIVAYPPRRILVDLEQVVRIAPINCGARLKLCNETLLTRALESASFDLQEAERLLSLGLRLEDARLVRCASKEAVRFFATRMQSPLPDIAATIIAWAFGKQELLEVFLRTCSEQNNLQLLSSFSHVAFWREIISTSLKPGFEDAFAFLMRDDVKAILDLDVHIRLPPNRTLLHEAAYSFSTKMIDVFLDAGVDPDIRDERGVTAAEAVLFSGMRYISRSSESYVRLLKATTRVSGDVVVTQLDYRGQFRGRSVLHAALEERALPLIERVVDSLPLDQIYSLYFHIGTSGRALPEWLLSIPGTAPLLQRLFNRSEQSQIATHFPVREICIENLSVAERILRARGGKCSLVDFDSLIFRSNIAEYSHIFALIDPTQWKQDTSLRFTSSMLYRIVDNLPASQEAIILSLLDGLEANVDPHILSASFGSQVCGKNVIDILLSKEPPLWRRVAHKLVQMASKVNFPIDAGKMQKLQECAAENPVRHPYQK